ncbi:MAG: AAA family ATPase [Lachnospiraceae bacterium]|nr:AAA family ATPase [Lachnospiraceae bacterium]MBR5994206.1 AAA family ATPase [Lachnospiraceae bacterium]
MNIVEFVGLPGSGKSTICKKYEYSLKKRQFLATNVQVQALMLRGVKRRLVYFAVHYYPKCRKVAAAAKKYVPNLKDKEVKAWIFRMKQIVYLLDKYEKEGLEYAVMDEGFIQFITSLCHDEAMPAPMMDFAKAVMDIVYTGRNCKFIYVETDKEEIIKRIRERNRPGDRFLSDSDEVMMGRLELKENNLLKCLELLDDSLIKKVHLEGEIKLAELVEMLE